MVPKGEAKWKHSVKEKTGSPIFSKDDNHKVWKNKLDMLKIVCSIPPYR